MAAVLTTVLMLVKNYARHPCRLGDCTDPAGVTDWCSVGQCSGWCTAEQLSLQPERCPGGTDGVSSWPRNGDQFLRALPLIAFALQCHIQGAAVYNEMPPRLKSSAAASMAIAAASSCLLAMLYLPMGLAGYAAFGAVTQGDVLTNFGADDPLANVARGCISVTALCAYPMQHFPARLVIHNAWLALRRGCISRAQTADGRLLGGTPPLGAPSDEPVERPTPPRPSHEPSTTFVIAESFSWCLLVLGLSLAAAGSSLSGVFSLVGALCGGNVIFTIPGALWLHFGSGGWARRLVIAAPLLAVGGLITVFGTYATIKEMVSGGER